MTAPSRPDGPSAPAPAPVQVAVHDAPRAPALARAWLWVALVLLALLAYGVELGGQYAPTNGDELVYTHIARRTAETGHWLPLASDLPGMRNTKPPLLFWQALVAGDWGARWHMAALRTPSLLYTGVLTLWLGWLGARAGRRWSVGVLAACTFLAFFSTFRYGRTYLTSAPETFWLGLPVLVWLTVLLRRAASPATKGAAQATNPTPDALLGWGAHAALGLALGLGLLYKSFALIAPAAATLWAVQWVAAPGWQRAWRLGWRVALSGVLALGLFALWFVADPDPGAVWREFVVGENAGKLRDPGGYWHAALAGGGSSLWAQALGYAVNAGLLAPLVLVAMAVAAWRLTRPGAWARRSAFERSLIAWLAVWMLVFLLPSQRSARYLIPAMPALALLLAQHADRLPRWAYAINGLVVALGLAGLARIAAALADLGLVGATQWGAAAWAVAALGLVLVALSLSRRVGAAARLGAGVGSVLALYLCLNATTAPLNGAAGQYDVATQARLRGARLAAPSSFNGQFERYRLLLPVAAALPYDGEARADLPAAANTAYLDDLLARHDVVAWLQTRAETDAPLCAPRCVVLGSRWEVRGRHRSGDITWANVGWPQTWLLRREWLLAAPRPAPTGLATGH